MTTYSLHPGKLYLILHAKELGRRLKGIFTIFSGMKSNDSVPVINCRLSLKFNFFFFFNTFPRYRSDDVLAPSRICANKHNVHNAQRNTSRHFVYLSSGRKVTTYCVKMLKKFQLNFTQFYCNIRVFIELNSICLLQLL